MTIYVFTGYNVKRTNVFDGRITYRYKIGYTNVPDVKVILEYTHGKAVPMSARVHHSVFKDKHISKELSNVLKRKVVLPTECDGEWYELQNRRK